MTKYLKRKDGKFAGSIGNGKANAPTSPGTPPVTAPGSGIISTPSDLDTLAQRFVSATGRETYEASTEEIRDGYSFEGGMHNPDSQAEFDLWLAKRDAQQALDIKDRVLEMMKNLPATEEITVLTGWIESEWPGPQAESPVNPAF